MADSSVAITAGSGTNIDTQIPSGGDHRQVVVLGSPNTVANVAEITAGGELETRVPNVSVTGTISANDALGGSPAGGGALISTAPTASSFVAAALTGQESSISIQVTGTFGSGTVWFEGSLDSTNGSDGSWFLLSVRTVGDIFTVSPINSATTARVVRTSGGMGYVRARITGATSPSVSVRITSSAGVTTVSGVDYMPAPPITKATQGGFGYTTQDLKDAGRTYRSFWANAAAAGATGTETAITLTGANTTFGGATSTAASWTPTSGKRFRIQQILVAARGHNTATAQITTFNFRVNTAGAVTTSSNIVTSTAVATPATANSWDRALLTIPDGFEIAGNGTLQFGITAAATYTTNAPTWFVNIIGYEY